MTSSLPCLTLDANDKPPLLRAEVLQPVGVAGDPHDGQCGAGDQPEKQVGVVVGDKPPDDHTGYDDASPEPEGPAAAEPVGHPAADQRPQQQAEHQDGAEDPPLVLLVADHVQLGGQRHLHLGAVPDVAVAGGGGAPVEGGGHADVRGGHQRGGVRGRVDQWDELVARVEVVRLPECGEEKVRLQL